MGGGVARIYSVHTTDGTSWAGIEAQLFNLHLGAMASPETLELIFAFTREGETAARFRAAGAVVWVLPARSIEAAATLRRRVRELGPDTVVHVHGYLGTVLGWAATVGTGVPLVATFHGAIESVAGPRRRIWWYSRGAKLIARFATACAIAVSERTARDWVAQGYPRDRLRIVHNGIVLPSGTDARRAVGPGLRVGTIGRLVPVKDHALLIEVARIVAARRPGVRFSIYGEGPLRRELEALRDRLGLRAVVELPGFAEDAFAIVRSFDVFLLTSHSEGIPYSLLEAMSVACPVVAPAVGGLPEILRDGENALVATERSADAIAACLGRVLEDEELRGRLGRGARETIEAGFSAPAMVGRMLEIYREILPREGPDPA